MLDGFRNPSNCDSILGYHPGIRNAKQEVMTTCNWSRIDGERVSSHTWLKTPTTRSTHAQV